MEHTLREHLTNNRCARYQVLILVLVEHTLRERNFVSVNHHAVLILVLVEHTLRGRGKKRQQAQLCSVLILVLVEHTLREQIVFKSFMELSLNPCFSGTYSQRHKGTLVEIVNRLS